MLYTILSICLIASIILNVFLVWFAWKSLKQIAEYDEELTELTQIMKGFGNHLQSVYEMEMFYGDETLRHLLRHAGDIISLFDTYDLLLQDEEEYDDYSEADTA